MPEKMDNSTTLLPNSTMVFNTTTSIPSETFTTNTTGMTDEKSNAGNYAETFVVYLFSTTLPILIPLGLIGNGISFAVMIKLARETTFYIFLAALAVSDFCYLLLAIVPRFIQLSGFYPLFVNDVVYTCSIAFYPLLVFSEFSSWITVAATVHRYIAIAYPLNATTYCTTKRSLSYLGTIFLVICTINFPVICFQWNADYTQCIFPRFTDEFCLKYPNYYDMLLYVIIPVGLIICFNSLIVRELYIASKVRRKLVNRQGAATRNNMALGRNDAANKTTLILFLVTATFLISLLPVAGGYVYMLIADTSTVYEENPTLIVLAGLSDFSAIINHTINFILYGLSGKVIRDRICWCRR